MCLGIPAKIVAICDTQSGLALAETKGVKRQVNIALLADNADKMRDLEGQWVLLHVGFAMAIIDQHEAAKSLKLLDELELQDE